MTVLGFLRGPYWVQGSLSLVAPVAKPAHDAAGKTRRVCLPISAWRTSIYGISGLMGMLDEAGHLLFCPTLVLFGLLDCALQSLV